MKAITIKQPWSSLIVHGIKDIENRTWKCPKKYIGKRVLIHASATPINMVNPSSVFTHQQWDFLTEEQKMLTISGAMPTSAIIGSVEIVDCVINHPSIWAEKTDISLLGDVLDDLRLLGRAVPPKVVYNWVLANPVLFEKPIPAKGELSFWDYPGIKEVLQRIKEKGD